MTDHQAQNFVARNGYKIKRDYFHSLTQSGGT